LGDVANHIKLIADDVKVKQAANDPSIQAGAQNNAPAAIANIDTGGGDLQLVVDNTAQKETTATIQKTADMEHVVAERRTAQLDRMKSSVDAQLQEIKHLASAQQRSITVLMQLATSSHNIEKYTQEQLREMELQREINNSRRSA